MCFWFEGSMQKKRDGKKCLVTDEADALGNVGLQISPPKSGLSSGWYAKARGSHVACLDLVTCKPGEKTAAWKKLSSWQLGNSATQENVRLWTQECALTRLQKHEQSMCSHAHHHLNSSLHCIFTGVWYKLSFVWCSNAISFAQLWGQDTLNSIWWFTVDILCMTTLLFAKHKTWQHGNMLICKT